LEETGLYPEFWDVIGGPWYLGYMTPTNHCT
jgi:hypothetical protein